VKPNGLCVSLAFLLVLGCSSKSEPSLPADAATCTPGTAGCGGPNPDAGSSLDAATPETDGAPSPLADAGSTPNVPLEAGMFPGCALGGAAFCDDFEKGPTMPPSRGGDLDPARWSAGRVSPQEISGQGKANPAPVAPIPACRASLPKMMVHPPEDTLICDATADHSARLLTAVSMQNYGVNSYRIRQPFDFAGRTGRITFDVDAVMASGLGAWASVEIIEDPTPTPSFLDHEHGPQPRNGIEIQFNNDKCLIGGKSAISVGKVDVFNNYVAAPAKLVYPPNPQTPDCVATRKGDLNHFEIQLSQTELTVLASDASPDGGKTFPNLHKIAAATINLPFTRGYVHITAHNHATVKWMLGPAWVYHWDNVGFDGPIVSNWREYEIRDSLTPREGNVNTGYIIRESTPQKPGGLHTCCPETKIAPLEFTGVNLTDVVSAKLAFSSYYLTCCGAPADLTTINLQHRWNGGAWRDRFITAAEAAALKATGAIGNLSQVIDVRLEDLREGTNTIEFNTVNAPQTYPTVLANIDLILTTKP
jgi:hypothetical protein